ncbi:MAG: hypothetical protein JWN14_3748, partial [Chthonomonadales bacterium]|nr:hypothetical protein [Chthonomonadales bacterium]
MQADICPDIETSLLDARLSLVAHHLLLHSSVEDCVVLCRWTADHDSEILAYIVPSGPFVPSRLHTYLLEAAPDGPTPSAYIPLTRLPLTSEGQVDTATLLTLPIYDDAVIARLEARLGQEPGVDTVGVTIQDYAESLPSIHLSDLLPTGEYAQAEESGRSVQDSERVGQIRPAPVRPVAFSDGGPLEIPADAPKTFTEAIQRTAARFPTRGVTYVRSDGSELFQSYASLLAEAKCILAGLQKQGLKPGDRVILQVEALQDHFASFWACVLGGITPVTVAVAPSYSEPNGIVNKLYNTWKLLEQPVVLTSSTLIAPISGLIDLLAMQGLRVLTVDELKANPPSESIYPSKPEDLVFFQLTSGSTGMPKCIQERHQAVICHIHGSQQFNDYTPDNISFNWLPVDHVVPILTVHLKDVYLVCSQVHARPEVILSNPLLWLDLLERHRITHTWAPNFGFKLLADHLRDTTDRTWDLSSVRFFMNAGEQVTLPVVREFLQLTAPFGVSEQAMQPAFGMAEACTCMTYRNNFRIETDVHRFLKSSLSSDLIEAEPGDSGITDFVDLGPPMPGVQIRITDSENRPVREGVIGRFQIKGGVIMPGYLNNEAANREAFVGDGWFNSGDLGFILNGSLTLTGREKEMIIVRGANFYCYEIEDIVNTIPGVEPTFVGASAVEDPATGSEGLAIFFVPRVSHRREQIQVIKAIRMQVTASLGITPAFIVPLPKPEFPKTTSGKIQRTQMKKSLLAGEYHGILKELDVALNNANTLPAWFYRTVWRRKEIVAATASARMPGVALVFLDGEGLAEQTHLRSGIDSDRVTVAAGDAFARIGPNRFVLNPESAKDYHRLIATLHAEERPVTEVLHLWTYAPRPALPPRIDAIEAAQAQGLLSLIHLVQALAQTQGPDHSVRMLVASTHAQPTSPQESIAWEK